MRLTLGRRTDDLFDRFVRRLLFKNVTVPWRWPSDGEPKEAWEPFTFDPWQGGALAGLWGAAEGEPKGVVVCAHPTRRLAKGHFLQRGYSQFLRDAGYHVLLFDFNGFGRSTRRGFYYPADVLAAGREAQRRAPGLPVGLLGVCFGGSYGICAMAAPDHPFEAAILEAPYESAPQVLGAMGRAGRSDYRPFFHSRRIVMTLLGPLRPGLLPLRQARRLRDVRSLLFIVGGADDIAPRSVSERLMRACRRSAAPAAADCEIWEVPGGEHLKAPEADPAAYAARVTAFFDRALARRTSNDGASDVAEVALAGAPA